MAAPAPEFRHSSRVTATPGAVREALLELREKLQRARIDADLCGTMELVLAEAMNNIVEHAFDTPAQQSLRLEIRRGPGRFKITLIDTGRPMPELALPEPRLPSTAGPTLTLPDGGFGWFLIHRLAHAIHYERRGDENHLSFEIATI